MKSAILLACLFSFPLLACPDLQGEYVDCEGVPYRVMVTQGTLKNNKPIFYISTSDPEPTTSIVEATPGSKQYSESSIYGVSRTQIQVSKCEGEALVIETEVLDNYGIKDHSTPWTQSISKEVYSRNLNGQLVVKSYSGTGRSLETATYEEQPNSTIICK